MDTNNSTEEYQNRKNNHHEESTDESESCFTSKHKSECSDSSESYNKHHRSDSHSEIISTSPIGVWNLSTDYHEKTIEKRPSQLVLNADGTFNIFSAPDIGNNPFHHLLTPIVGIWESINDRKIKLKGSCIGYRQEDGNPEVYYSFHINMKLNNCKSQAKYCGKAYYDSMDDTRSCHTTSETFMFEGCGYQILESKQNK